MIDLKGINKIKDSKGVEMKKKVYIVRLSEEETKQLKEMISKGVHPARQVIRAHIAAILHLSFFPDNKAWEGDYYKHI